VPYLCIQRGCKCKKVSLDTVGNRTSRESQLAETPITWRNTSVTFTQDIRILVTGVNQFLNQYLMCDFVVPVLADNPLAFCPTLISLYV